jgi:hypothetical protein
VLHPPEEVNISAYRLCTLVCLGVVPFLFLSAESFAQDALPGVADDVELGRRIYVEGILPSGAPLQGTRFGSTTVSGAAAACVSCHRPSGMGQVEGDILVPPISGNFLYATSKDKQFAVMDPRVSKLLNQAHEPYTELSLAEAINHGKNNSGIEMGVAMPRYTNCRKKGRRECTYSDSGQVKRSGCESWNHCISKSESGTRSAFRLKRRLCFGVFRKTW